MCRLALLPAVVLLALVAPPLTSAAADGPGATGKVSYRPPVDGPIVDPYRPPANRWDSGNRGVDYAPGTGTPVKAAADGEVVFAGSVGGRLHVVLLHADGIRTSYSFLATIAVHRGDRLRQGEVVGTSGERLHFGARAGDDYIDPTTLFDTGPPHVFLVPDALRRPGTEAQERAGLLRQLGSRLTQAIWQATAPQRAVVGVVAQQVAGEVAGTLHEVAGAVHYGAMLSPVTHAAGLAAYTVNWARNRDDCTPPSVAPPPLPEPRVAVLVGGLGSSTTDADVDAVDPSAMGYLDHVRFSYDGGSTRSSPYDGRDTTVDLQESGRRFVALLEQVHREHPGVAVDVIAHSQGGLVARSGLAYDYDADDGRFPRVANLITLGTPHTGTDGATALMMVGRTDVGESVRDGVDASGLLPWDLGGESVHQMSETSLFLLALNWKPLPDGIRFTSIGDRADVVVSAMHTLAPGARSAIVSGPALDDHGSLPGSTAGRREVALAAAGMPPTCEGFGEMVLDYVTASSISYREDALGAALWAGGRWIDRRAGWQPPPVALPKRRNP